jgi:hypothetical protein
MNYSKTTYFILPVLDLQGSFKEIKKDGFIDSYLGWTKHLENAYGQYIYVLFDKNLIPASRLQELDNHNALIDKKLMDDVIVYIFSMNNDFKKDVIEPFIQGKYSQIDRKFVQQAHPTHISEDTLSYGKNKARLVLDKSPEIREEWEEQLGVKLPTNAEVWSIPSKEDEILDYLQK